MDTYFKKDIVGTSLYLFETLSEGQRPHHAAKSKRNLALFKTLMQEYPLLLQKYCVAPRNALDPMQPHVIFTGCALLHYQEQHWLEEPYSKRKLCYHVLYQFEKQLEQQLQSYLALPVRTWKAIAVQTQSSQSNVHLLGLYYRDCHDALHFYLMNCRLPNPDYQLPDRKCW